jgi:hypothetical protein
VCANVRVQSFDGPPDPAYSGLPVRKLGDFPHARQPVPNLNQPAARPVCGQCRKLLLVGELRRSPLWRPLFGRGGHGDCIASINGEDSHASRVIALLPRTVKRNLPDFRLDFGDSLERELPQSRLSKLVAGASFRRSRVRVSDRVERGR